MEKDFFKYDKTRTSIDKCDICKSRDSAIGCHGISNGDVYSVYYCAYCYVRSKGEKAEKAQKYMDAIPEAKAGQPRKVKVGDVVYNSLKAAAQALGVSPQMVRAYCMGKSKPKSGISVAFIAA